MKYFPLIILLILLSACGTGAPVAVTALPPAPAVPQPAQALPTLSPDTLVFDNVPRQIFTHPSGLFSIEYPDNWQVFEQANGVIFVDPTLRAAYGVLFSQADTELSAPELGRFAEQFVRTQYAAEDGFEILTTEGPVIRFKSRNASLGEAVTEFTVARQKTMIFFTQVMVVSSLWQNSAPAVRELAHSLQLDPAQIPTLPAATPTPAGPPAWALYTHPGGNFAFLYPDNWTVSATESGVQAVWPEKEFIFDVQIIPAPSVSAETARADLEQQAATLKTQFTDAQMLPVEAYQANQITGYTFDYLYTPPSGAAIAGSMIAVGVKDTLYRITISAPAPTYEAALEWFNMIMSSFQILDGQNLAP